MRNKWLASVLLIVGTIFCQADTVPPVNFQAIALLIKQRPKNPAPEEARFIAADFDVNFLPADYHLKAFHMPCLATRKSVWGGVDSLILHYTSPIKMTTIRSRLYWVMHAQKSAFPKSDPTSWIAERLGLQKACRIAESPWKSYQVKRFDVPEFKPLTSDDTLRYEKNRWMRTLRVMESDGYDDVIVYAQTDFFGQPEWHIKLAHRSRWFDEMKTPRNQSAKNTPQWWRFWKWQIWSKGKEEHSSKTE